MSVTHTPVLVLRRIAVFLGVLALCGGCDPDSTAAMAKVSEGVGFANRGDDTNAVRAFEEAAFLDEQNAYAH